MERKTVRRKGFVAVSRKRVWEWQNQEVRAYRLENDTPIVCHDLWVIFKCDTG